MPLVAYVAQDRRSALARGESLPDRAPGAALFADISGFTPLTEKLTRQFGARRGGEELTKRVNAVYDALIRSVEAQGGSVVDFAGDAITCWLSAANPNASLRALAAAQAMQTAMSGFPDLALKVAVTSGTARRLVAGDPRIQLLDTLAGGMIARLAVAEHLARPGEVVADAATLRACGGAFAVTEWRADPETGEPFAVVHASLRQVETMPAVAPSAEIPSETLRAWVLPAVYAREQSGLSEFLTELRPAVALFLRFGGIDYDGDDSAQEKLDSWIREVQHAAARYDGTLLQLTIGDKGSYLYVCFGAPTSHEDDARRAVQTALELREKAHTLPYLEPVQVGISRGTLRAGACGSATRRTYAALGDEVNVAARLMSVAAPGEIVVSERVQQALGERFTLIPRPPVTLKGKSGPLTVFTVISPRHRRATRLLEPEYRLPMIGRAEELVFLESKLELARQGQGQIIGITAEAGQVTPRRRSDPAGPAARPGMLQRRVRIVRHEYGLPGLEAYLASVL
jgi:class 3 adenylate cyclase